MKFGKLVLSMANDEYWSKGYANAITRLSDKISCSDSQAELLYNLALQLPYNSIIVELGVWTGKSTMAMGEAAKERGHRVYAVDHFLGSPSDETKDLSLKRDIAYEFQQNVSKFGLSHWVQTLQWDSRELVKLWSLPIDFLFIDGDHEYSSVIDDIYGWTPHVKIGGVISGHDYDIPGVQRAVNECFNEFSVEDNIWITKRME